MKVLISKQVEVDITDEEVRRFRKENPSATHNGVLSKDDNVIYILALNKATELISRFDASVRVTTSIINPDLDSVK